MSSWWNKVQCLVWTKPFVWSFDKTYLLRAWCLYFMQNTECKSLLKRLLRMIQGMASRMPVVCGMVKGPLLLGASLRTALMVLVESNLSHNHFGKTHDWSDREIRFPRNANGIVWSWDSGMIPSELFEHWTLVHHRRVDGKKNSPDLACDVIITHKVKERVVDSHSSHTAVMGVGLDVLTPAPCKSLRSSSQLWEKLAEWEAFSCCLFMV